MLEKTHSVATGTGGTPSVRGSFYLTDLLAPTNAGYGPYAFGLSAYSEVLTSFGGGRVKLVSMERRIQRASGSPLVTVAFACRMPTSQPSRLSCRSEPRSRSSEGRRSQVVASCGKSLRRPGNELMMAPASPTPSGSSVHPTMSQAVTSGGPPAINT